MKNSFRQRALPLVTTLVLGAVAMSANAQNAKTGYWQDLGGNMVRSTNGECVRTGHWTKDLATAKCDPGLMPKVAAAPAAPAPEKPSEPVAVTKPMPVTEKVAMEADALFDFDKAELKPKGKEVINEVVRKLELAGAKLETITTTGYTDNIGSTAYNIDLSLRRAEAVKTYLISQGIDSNQINSVGKGEREPFAKNNTAEDRAKNRRVDIEVSATRITQ